MSETARSMAELSGSAQMVEGETAMCVSWKVSERPIKKLGKKSFSVVTSLFRRAKKSFCENKKRLFSQAHSTE
jgi:hypothetical protein